ncbi:unnamed protein product [Dovyalis caffra]|uniref:ATP-grasp domain-containing protein n=1 Tax=Dovyalis caffra TaxID=77055 RepID=A0AAV1R3E1_9ROSI|nr:unnamed protein product [Dovyalis caffra]
MSAHPKRNSIGYALPPKKIKTFIQPSLIQQAKEHNIELIPIDPSKPLIEQGPFDCIIHKIYGPDWKSQLQHFSSQNPNVPIIDSLDSIQRLHNRVSMIQVVSNLKLPQRDQVLDVPKQHVSDLQQTLNSNDELIRDLGFPLIAKPLMANGGATSHKMYLVFDKEGLDKLETPIILQEFVNHGGVIFKAYVAGDYVKCVKRKSLPDLKEGKSVTLKGLLPFSQISNLSVEENSGFESVEMPPVDFVEEVAKAIKEETGINLFNFDVIRDARDAHSFDVVAVEGFGPLLHSRMLATFAKYLKFLYNHKLRKICGHIRKPCQSVDAIAVCFSFYSLILCVPKQWYTYYIRKTELIVGNSGFQIPAKQLFFLHFEDLVGKEVTIELKNDLPIRRALHSVDQYPQYQAREHSCCQSSQVSSYAVILLFSLEKIYYKSSLLGKPCTVSTLSIRNCFIRGSVVSYVQPAPDGVDVDLLHDAMRRELGMAERLSKLGGFPGQSDAMG